MLFIMTDVDTCMMAGMIMMTRCMPMPVVRKTFTADHPFMIMLVQTDSVGNKNNLFIGRTTKPTVAA